MAQAPMSWGRVHREPQPVQGLPGRHAVLPDVDQLILPYGNGRSYGDSNLNPQGLVLRARDLDRFIRFDAAQGVLECESGVLLEEILRLVVPQGWFLPVTPGTQFVTVGGAIANDVHGKNHHVAGSFGNHVEGFELLRSDGSRRWCSPQEESALFAATIGGLGLTGLITQARIRLRRIHNPYMAAESVKFRNLGEFFELSEESECDHEYTVSWIDCAWGGKRLGRGLFSRANHAPAQMNPADMPPSLLAGGGSTPLTFPMTPPVSLVNGLSLRAFNLMYFHKQRRPVTRGLQHYRPFFYPLDGLLEWNRMYGPKGFYQYQCALPREKAHAVTRDLLEVISASGMGSFLAVLKQFGEPASRGMLSFPMPGTTLALDFPNAGLKLHRLFASLDALVLAAGGRLYVAKDGRMSGAMFRAGYPRLNEFMPHVDPKFSSAWWRRVMES